MSFRGRILDEIISELKRMEFRPADGDDAPELSREAIVYRRLPALANGIYQPFKIDESPCLVITQRTVRIPPEEGEVGRDDWYFEWLFQICSQSLGNTGANQKTYWDWQESIADQFNFNWLNDRINDERGCVREAVATMIDDVDEKVWAKATTFVAGIVYTTIVRKKRRVGQ